MMLKKQGYKIPRDLNSLMSLAGRTFEDVRYAHERAPAGNFYLTDLPALLRSIIIGMKPSWK